MVSRGAYDLRDVLRREVLVPRVFALRLRALERASREFALPDVVLRYEVRYGWGGTEAERAARFMVSWIIKRVFDSVKPADNMARIAVL